MWVSGKLESALPCPSDEIQADKIEHQFKLPWSDYLDLSLLNLYMELKRKHTFVSRSVKTSKSILGSENKARFAIFNVYGDKINFKNKLVRHSEWTGISDYNPDKIDHSVLALVENQGDFRVNLDEI